MADTSCPVCKEPRASAEAACVVCGLVAEDRIEDDAAKGAALKNEQDDQIAAAVDAESPAAEPQLAPPASEEVIPLRRGPTPEQEPEPEPDPARAAAELDETRFFAELKRIQDRKSFAIIFLGFREAGKTWLLHRIKEQLFERDGVNCEPPFERVETSAGERKELPGTTTIEFHHVLGQPGFVLIDIPGEQTRELMNAKFRDLRMLLAAMNYAQAMIVALPSDVMMFGPLLPTPAEATTIEDEDEAERRQKEDPPDPDAELLAIAGGDTPLGPKATAAVKAWADALRKSSETVSSFAFGLFRVAAILSYLRHNNIDPADDEAFEKVSADNVLTHIMSAKDWQKVGGVEGMDYPTFFALTKADRVLPLFGDASGDGAGDLTGDALLAKLDAEIGKRRETRVMKWLAERARIEPQLLADPWQFVRATRKSLHGQIVNSFPMAKFDYVTAFYGHDGKTSLTSQHYERHPPHGVYEVLEWILRVRSSRRLPSMLRFHHRLARRARHFIADVPRPRQFDFHQGQKS